MLVAIASDFARVPECDVVVLWNAHLPLPELDGVEIELVSSAEDERRLLKEVAADCDAAFLIAPETDGILAEQRRIVDEAGSRFLGCSLEAIELCTDKLKLFEHLSRHRVPTIQTAACRTVSEIPPATFPIVVKPRDGAGSQDTFLLKSSDDLDALFTSNGFCPNGAIRQPYVPGRPISIGAIVRSTPEEAELFPVGQQRLTSDGRFGFLGGTIPAEGVSRESVETFIRRAIESIPGLSGYVGFDLVVAAEDADDVRLVEINPRLTTSYLGYRAMTDDNLAARMLLDSPSVDGINWKQQNVKFDADGTVQVHSGA